MQKSISLWLDNILNMQTPYGLHTWKNIVAIENVQIYVHGYNY